VQKIGLLRSVKKFRGFLGYLEWQGLDRKFFLETEGPTVIFPNVQGLWQNL
jgi:hypothetical protein